MRTDENGRQRLSNGESLPRCELCNGAPCKWDKQTEEWICHRFDTKNCHAKSTGDEVYWYCTLEKGHKEDHECRVKGRTISRWKK